MDLNKFRHTININVKFHEVDMLGVCNNAIYINYFEDARLDYMKSVGLIPKGGIFSDGKIYFIVRNEVNYCSHAHFDDELVIYTRVPVIKNSSFSFEHIVINKKTKSLIAFGSGVIVHVNQKTHKSSPIPKRMISIIKNYEKFVKVIGNKKKV
jgi:acyl-CoA thioester hydrolase